MGIRVLDGAIIPVNTLHISHCHLMDDQKISIPSAAQFVHSLFEALGRAI